MGLGLELGLGLGLAIAWMRCALASLSPSVAAAAVAAIISAVACASSSSVLTRCASRCLLRRRPAQGEAHTCEYTQSLPGTLPASLGFGPCVVRALYGGVRFHQL